MAGQDENGVQSTFPGAVQKNIQAISALQRHLAERRGPIDQLADGIGDFSGSIGFVFLHVVWFTAWFLVNTGVIPGFKHFDPYPFILLAMVVSVEGVLRRSGSDCRVTLRRDPSPAGSLHRG